MGLGCGMTMIKYILFIFNLLCALCGIALLTIGIILIVQVKDILDYLKEYNIAAVPIILIVFGSVILIISFFGCCGAIKESHCMTMVYSVFLILLIIGQIVLGAYVLVHYEDVASAFQKHFNQVWTNRELDGNREAIDAFQRLAQCCGNLGPSDWVSNIPNSCCASNNSCNINDAFKKGCGTTIETFFKDSGVMVGIVLLCLAAVELVAFIFACCLANSIRNQERRQYA